MITITNKGISIEIRGLYDEETVYLLTRELLDALQIACAAKDKGSNYYYLFLLLQSIVLDQDDPKKS